MAILLKRSLSRIMDSAQRGSLCSFEHLEFQSSKAFVSEYACFGVSSAWNGIEHESDFKLKI